MFSLTTLMLGTVIPSADFLRVSAKAQELKLHATYHPFPQGGGTVMLARKLKDEKTEEESMATLRLNIHKPSLQRMIDKAVADFTAMGLTVEREQVDIFVLATGPLSDKRAADIVVEGLMDKIRLTALDKALDGLLKKDPHAFVMDLMRKAGVPEEDIQKAYEEVKRRQAQRDADKANGTTGFPHTTEALQDMLKQAAKEQQEQAGK
jgi:hypothetical protein